MATGLRRAAPWPGFPGALGLLLWSCAVYVVTARALDAPGWVRELGAALVSAPAGAALGWLLARRPRPRSLGDPRGAMAGALAVWAVAPWLVGGAAWCGFGLVVALLAASVFLSRHARRVTVDAVGVDVTRAAGHHVSIRWDELTGVHATVDANGAPESWCLVAPGAVVVVPAGRAPELGRRLARLPGFGAPRRSTGAADATQEVWRGEAGTARPCGEPLPQA